MPPSLRALFPDLVVVERERAYERKLEALAIDIQRRHGLPGEPHRITVMGPPRLTEAMMKLIARFRVAHVNELARVPPPKLPLGLLPVLMERLPEDTLSSVLTAMRAAARGLHDEDDSPSANAARFFERLQWKA